jgi:hypothetical protein
MYARCRCMVEFVCSLHNLYLCADFRPEPAIVTTRFASFDTDMLSPTISASSIG